MDPCDHHGRRLLLIVRDVLRHSLGWNTAMWAAAVLTALIMWPVSSDPVPLPGGDVALAGRPGGNRGRPGRRTSEGPHAGEIRAGTRCGGRTTRFAHLTIGRRVGTPGDRTERISTDGQLQRQIGLLDYSHPQASSYPLTWGMVHGS